MATGRIPGTAGSPLTAKGDLFGYSTTAARVPVGSDGSILVANSAASTGLGWQATPSSNNPIINSGFDVAQRGTSISLAASTTTTTYTLDRWCTRTGANQATTVSQQATSDTTNLPNIQYCARFQRNSGQTGTSTYYFIYNLESIDSRQFAGKTVTLSFYARAGSNFSSSGNLLNIYLASGTGTDQNLFTGFTNQTAIVSPSSTLTTTWQRFTYSGSVASTATQLGLYFQFTPTGTAGANDYFEVTGVQIDIGSVALPYRRNSATIQGELAACQRYYYLVASGNTQPLGAAWTDTTTQGQIMIPFPVTMRTTPSIVQIAGTNYYNINTANSGKLLNSFTGINVASTTMATIYGTISGATAGQGGYSYTANASASIAMNAEL